MIDAEGLVAVALFLFWIWALLDCIATDSALCRNLPKPMWIILVLILPDIGALIWLLLGRPEKADWRPGSADYAAPRRPVGVEDSPRYPTNPSVTDRRSEELDKRLSTLSLDTVIRFRSAADRAAFSQEFAAAITTLAARYHDESAPGGRPHRLVAVAHPLPQDSALPKSPANKDPS